MRKQVRKQFEVRDDAQRAAIQAILNELPQDHPAVQAYRAGADVIQLTHFVDREDLADKLHRVWLDWYARKLRRGSNAGHR